MSLKPLSGIQTKLGFLITRSSFWYPGKAVGLVFDTPGYRTAIRIIIVDKWGRTPAEAALNANNVDVNLVKDIP
jgi:hypothetical protein